MGEFGWVAGKRQAQRSGGRSFKLKRKADLPFRWNKRNYWHVLRVRKWGLRSPLGSPLSGWINWDVQSL